jgi:hypothetical protein
LPPSLLRREDLRQPEMPRLQSCSSCPRRSYDES